MKKISFVFLLLTLALPLFAEDLNPPPWRGHLRSTLQIWEFEENNSNPLPDLYDGPFNPQPADVIPVGGDQWLPDLDGMTGVWPLSGEIYVPIENFPEPLDQKLIWVQLTWKTKGNQPATEASGDNGPMVAGNLIGQTALDQGWYHSTYQIILQPNPSEELVHIYGAIYLDEMVIDTICIPEPATVVLMTMGGFLAALRKRK